jgi:hypothetical protein
MFSSVFLDICNSYYVFISELELHQSDAGINLIQIFKDTY